MKISRSAVLKSDTGSALIEFVFFGLIVQIGILLFASDLLTQQKYQIAVTSTARQAARAAALTGQGFTGSDTILRQQNANFDLEPGRLSLKVDPIQPQPGDVVTATATLDSASAVARMRVPR